MLLVDDCPLTGEATCPPGESFGSDQCAPVSVTDCPTAPPTETSGTDGIWGTVGSAAPWVLVGLLLLALIGVVVWLLVEMSRRRRADAKAAAAFRDAEGWKASAQSASQNRPAASPVQDDLLEQLVTLADFPQSAGAGAQLEQVIAAAGLVPLTANPGDRFDDTVHRARTKRPTPDPAYDRTIAEVIRPGYRTANRIVRPADVSVWIHG
ncbi:nucleotide exchange factor GrpE [Leifsonia sp. YIM 134122]|uniref:Nucleotide exchange factor GrpE n=1 Tax=Leifsonia stereocauli TaxID=3134136 RepID=A0ABU9W3K7_9MICO